jgi:hypothetical protein
MVSEQQTNRLWVYTKEFKDEDTQRLCVAAVNITASLHNDEDDKILGK